MDTNEVLGNLEKLCKASKFTFEEHEYLQAGIAMIKEKLDRLEKLEKPELKEVKSESK